MRSLTFDNVQTTNYINRNKLSKKRFEGIFTKGKEVMQCTLPVRYWRLQYSSQPMSFQNFPYRMKFGFQI